MARIQINDLNINKELDAKEMQDITGGRRRRRRVRVGWRTVTRRRRVRRYSYQMRRVRVVRLSWVTYKRRVGVYRWV